MIFMGMAVLALLLLPTLAREWLGIGATTVLTGSMRPAIDPGDLVITRISEGSTIGVGDIVIAKSGDISIAHRVVEVRDLNGLNRLTTKGDANATIDTDPVMVSASQAIPRVIWRIPSAGNSLSFLASPDAQRLGLTLLVGANLLALAVFALRRRPEPRFADAEGGHAGPRPTDTDIESVNA